MLPARFQERHQVGKLLNGQLLVEPCGHHRDRARANLLDVGSVDPHLLVGSGHQQDLLGGLVLEQSIMDLALGSSDDHGFIAANEAVLG